jgi:3-ketosteroid 9alpha-monooxygenase subunit A
MVDRFEFEIDTTRPREAWTTEVEHNIAAGIIPAVVKSSSSPQ